jgi:hypothetical protein
MNKIEYLQRVAAVIQQYNDGAITLEEVVNWIIANYPYENA